MNFQVYCLNRGKIFNLCFSSTQVCTDSADAGSCTINCVHAPLVGALYCHKLRSLAELMQFHAVSLRAQNTNEVFRGFMLKASVANNSEPKGTFTLIDLDISQLQSCAGTHSQVVTQTTNRAKNHVPVLWSTPEPGFYCFRVTFIKDYDKFWLPTMEPSSTQAPVTTPVPSVTTTPLTSEMTSTTPVTSVMTSTTHLTSGLSTEDITSSHTSVTSSRTSMPTFTSTEPPDSTATDSTVTEAPTRDRPVLIEISLILSLLNYLSVAECFPSLMKHRKSRSSRCMTVMSILSLVFSLVAFILLLISAKHVAASILTGLVMVLTICQTFLTQLIVFSGPSHELRQLFCWSLGLVAFANMCFTTAAIFVQLVKYSCSWLPVVMGVYFACTLLLIASYICEFKKNLQIRTASNKQKDTSSHKRVSWYYVIRLVITLVNLSFTAALIVGILFCTNK
ncbi:uncharacterized protein LOC143512993 isoform X2 [Brachyhypopomus gauderio]|uniref:uncharacterized protein LOC143512993 isoform X2 n=1 Tax=Brachyhypopomus gauderio TaxID=698409 RepID=UPI004040EF40